MTNYKKKILIATGGTGGHIFPAYSLAKYFIKKNFTIKITTDKRGLKYFKKENDIKLRVINSSTVFKKNFFKSVISFLEIIFAFFNSFIFLLSFKPKIVFGMGGYSSFPVCMAAWVLRIPFVIYENNLYVGKTNKYLLPLAKKLMVSYSSIEGINYKYKSKIVEIGNILREEILNFEKENIKLDEKKIHILILGGSQAAKIFGEKIPEIFKMCKKANINIKVFQQCLPNQNNFLEDVYKKNNIEFEVFNFTHDIKKYFSKIDFAITRAGSSMLAELLNCRIPILSIPLPSSADNHQLKNAKFFQKKGYSFLIEEKEIDIKLLPLIKSVHRDKEILSLMKSKQKLHTDKNVFTKVFAETENLIIND